MADGWWSLRLYLGLDPVEIKVPLALDCRDFRLETLLAKLQPLPPPSDHTQCSFGPPVLLALKHV